MQAMKGATVALGSMNRSMNLPALQRIAMEFERENDIMEQRQEMMDDAVDDAMDVGVEEEGDEVVEQVLEEIGVDLNQSVSVPLQAPHTAYRVPKEGLIFVPEQFGETPTGLHTDKVPESRVAQAIGGPSSSGDPGDDDLEARLASLRK